MNLEEMYSMSRQGRMHGSPFHVETSRYKYAVEHEVEPYPFSKQRPNCTYYINTNHSCSLWNSGFSQCNSHKCPYLRDGLRRHGTCLECAFFYNEVCYNNHKPTKTTVSEAEAAFCCILRSPAAAGAVTNGSPAAAAAAQFLGCSFC